MDDTAHRLERYAAGDREVLEQLVSEHLPFVVGKVRASLAPPLDQRLETMDLVQEVMLRVTEHPPSRAPRNQAEFRGWLATVVRSVVVSQSRAHLGSKRDLQRETRSVTGIPATQTGPITRAQRNESSELLRAAMAELDEADRVVLTLRQRDAMTYADIAARVGKNEEAVRAQYRRGLEKLRGHFEQLRGSDRAAGR